MKGGLLRAYGMMRICFLQDVPHLHRAVGHTYMLALLRLFAAFCMLISTRPCVTCVCRIKGI